MRFKLVDTVDILFDSEGNQLSPSQILYFKDSKARDKNGNLLVCYHGSKNKFPAFNKKYINFGNALGTGFYFSADESKATQYGAVEKYYLNITNPMIHIKSNVLLQFLIDMGLKYNVTSDEIRTNTNLNTLVSIKLQQDGYDGVIVDDFSLLVIYEPNQVKSVENKTPTSSEDLMK